MMKLKSFVIALLCISVSVFGQESMQFNAPNLGETVPDFDINILANGSTTKFNIKDFRGKVVVLEFWATYCGPCLPAMAHLDSVQKQMPNQLTVIEITDEDATKVQNFISKKPTASLVAIDGKQRTLNNLFYHQFMPHTVVIDPNGVLKAITSPDQITDEVVRMIGSGIDVSLKLKTEYQPTDIALSSPVIQEKSLYKMAIFPYREGSQSQINKLSETEFEFVNCTLPLIYQTLYQNINAKACLEVTPQTRYLLQQDNDHQYCFSLSVPEKMKGRLAEIGLKYLQEFFELKVKPVKRTKKMYALQNYQKIVDTTQTNTDTDRPVFASTYTVSDDSANAQTQTSSIKDFLKLIEDCGLSDLPIQNDSQKDSEELITFKKLPKEVSLMPDYLRKLGFQLARKDTEKECFVIYEDTLLTGN
jgi:thiol-disulfide isomerase/thioredoxin